MMQALFKMSPEDVARRLIGATLTVDGVGGIVVETEAYARDDPASHSYVGLTLRNAAIFGAPSHAYVYRAYGLHWRLNLVCGPTPGAAMLLRALEPTRGVDQMISRRGLMDPRRLTAGPGRLCQALAVSADHNGLPIAQPPFRLTLPVDLAPVVTGPRIGINKAIDRPWRFGLAGSRYLSRPFPTAADRRTHRSAGASI